MSTWAAALSVAAGGALGSLARWGIGLGLSAYGPWPTLAINALGSLAIGVLAAWPSKPEWMHPLLMVGVCGGFTTFSSFSLHALELWQQQRSSEAAAYVVASLVACLTCVAVGWWLGRWFTA